MESGYRTVLDIVSKEIPVYGQQEQIAYYGHFESTCYHPMLWFSWEGECPGAKLRPAMYTVPRVVKNSFCPRIRASRC